MTAGTPLIGYYPAGLYIAYIGLTGDNMRAKYLALLMTFALFAAFANPVTAARPSSSWTYLVYMGADNSLDTLSGDSLNLMQQGLASLTDSSVQVNVIVLYDRPNNAPTELLQVTPTRLVPLPTWWTGNQNLDSGNAATLKEFVTWGVTYFRADYYAVVIWGHGGGWKYIMLDVTSNSRMSIVALADALASVQSQSGRKVDVTVFDACLMSLVEVADQLKNATNYVIASEEAVPARGFPYDLMLKHLGGNPSVANYANAIADDYYAFHAQGNGKATLSIASIDENKLPSLTGHGGSIDALSGYLIANMAKYYPAIDDARAVAQHQVYGVNGSFWYVDLYQFVDQLALRIPDPTVAALAQRVKIDLDNAIYERHSHNLDGKAYGLGINFPPNLARYNDKTFLAQNYAGLSLTFVNNTQWDDMLLAFYAYQK